MGSKNLKAIAVKGTKGIDIYDPEGFVETANSFIEALHRAPRVEAGWKTYGTLILVEGGQQTGYHPFRNSQYTTLPEDRVETLGS